MKKVSILGIGKLGLGFALLLAKNGHDVCGVDISSSYVDSLNNKTFDSSEPGYNELLKETSFHATTSLQEGLDHSDLIFIVVQTPNGGGDHFYDHTILSNLLEQINNTKVSNKEIIVSCTVMPKYIDIIGTTLLNNCNVSYNPEFIAQGEVLKGFLNPDIVLLGTYSENLKKEIKELYDSIVENSPEYCFMTPLEAEIVKISLNGYITTKIAYANMISDLCDTLNCDKFTVLKAIGRDKRIGNKYFNPGFSYGGPCFPRDTKAVEHLMKQYNINNDILTGTHNSNEFHVEFQTTQLLKSNKSNYIFTNVCYKEQDLDIIEESAKLKIAKHLVENGKTVIIKNNIKVINAVKKSYGNVFKYFEV